MDLQALTGHFYLQNGQLQEDTAVPGILAQSPPIRAARGRSRDSLFVHLALTGASAEYAALADDLLGNFSQYFFQNPGSVTATLRQAILTLNQQLLRRNMAPGTPREGAITCAVLRDNELYVAQAGEGFAVLGHSFGVERIPVRKSEPITPLGRTAGISIRLHHHRLESGHMLLLGDPRLAYLTAHSLAPIIVDSDVEMALDGLERLVVEEEARVLLVEFTADVPYNIPVYDDAPAPSVTRPTPAPEQPITGVGLERTARMATASAARGLSRVTGGMAQVMNELQTADPVAEDPNTASRVLAGSLAIIIPIIVAAIFAGVYFQRGQVVVFSSTRQQMAQELSLGDQAADPATALSHYNSVLQLAASADDIRQGDAEVDRLRAEANDRLDRLQGVTRLEARPIVAYATGTNIVSLALGDELNGDIFALDAAGNQVFRHETDESYLNLTTEEPEIVVEIGQAVGNFVISELLDIMWRPRGRNVTRDGLAVLDNRGLLITYFPNFDETRATPLGFASQRWLSPTEINRFDERLYVLDPGADEIWRYFPEGDGFLFDDAQPAIIFGQEIALASVVDFAIYSEDGSVLLLYADGRLRRYVNGRLLWSETDLAQNGLATPLVAPTAVKITGSGLNSSIFVADPGSARVVQLSLGGTFLAQYKATDDGGRELFGQAADIAVAEVPLRIFVVVGDLLYAATQ